MAGVLHIELGLKIRVYVLRWMAVVGECTGARVENDTRPAGHKQCTHGHCICSPHVIDHYIDYVRHVGHAARSNHLRLFGLEYDKFSLHEKWNNCPHSCQTVIANGLNTIDCSRIHPWAWLSGFHRRDISYKIHIFIHPCTVIYLTSFLEKIRIVLFFLYFL